MDEADPNAATRAFLTYVLIPAWLAAGLLDWQWHRVTKIERSAGAHESLTHVLMSLEAGAGIAAAMLFEIDAGVIAAMLTSALVHEATVVWDIAYTKHWRPIPQAEDHTHSFLEVLPFVAFAFAAFARPAQARAMIGLGDERPRWRLRPNLRALPFASVLAVAAGGVLGVGPHVEELVRCLRVRPTLAPQPPPGR
ncbi:MAG TPA: hypothetical protein VGD09_17410 [Blastococcus sp.]|jgi:hypothetical protein